MRASFAICALLLLMPAAGQAGELDFGIVKTLEQLSLPVPDPANPIVCHGFGCAYRTPILLRNVDRAQIKKLFGAAAAKSPEGERNAVAATMAWFEKRVAAEAGTAGAKARAGLGHAGDPSQFDCLDKTSNTVGVLALLAQMGLLRHHAIDEPVSRGFIIGGLPHTTAVVRERKSGQKWVVDGWTHNNGELPDVMPLETWRTQS
ncbi:MAG: hypothetical protein E6G97_23520 [Alphaproteobacteria bacterium]|nr:MAG: hypothetical protein E6G97_23520 [Alphaproteobacteria bacterium]